MSKNGGNVADNDDKKKSVSKAQPTCKKTRHPRALNDCCGAAVPAERRYSRCVRLGSGSYGDVFLCWDCVERQHVAIKYFKKEDYGEEGALPQSALREISILRRCNHPNIIRMIDTLFGEKATGEKSDASSIATAKKGTTAKTAKEQIYVGGFIMPFLSGGDLYSCLCRLGCEKRRLGVRHTRRLARQLYSGIAYLHERGIVHRDIKPQNIMLDAQGTTATICDFGLGRMCSVPLGPYYSGTCCTLWYRPPELLMGERKYGVEIDLWSMALVVHEMLDGEPFANGTDECDQLFRIFRYLGTPNETVWPGVTILPHYRSSFPQWRQRDFTAKYPKSGSALANSAVDNGNDAEQMLDFMRQSIVYRPCMRMSARRALQHGFLLQQDDNDEHNGSKCIWTTSQAEEANEQQKLPRMPVLRARKPRQQTAAIAMSPPHRIAVVRKRKAAVDRTIQARKRSRSAPASTSPRPSKPRANIANSNSCTSDPNYNEEQ